MLENESSLKRLGTICLADSAVTAALKFKFELRSTTVV